MQKYFFFLFFLLNCCCFNARASLFDENEFNEKNYDTLYSNKSIISCGNINHLEVYSSFEVQLLLSISNALSSTKVNLETNWDNFSPPPLVSENFNEDKYNSLPSDIKRLLFLCLSWNESERLKLFVIPDAALANIASRLRLEKPWKTLNETTAKKVDSISDATLKQFIYTVLRANVFESARGNLLNNKSLWFISWSWLTPNSGIYQ